MNTWIPVAKAGGAACVRLMSTDVLLIWMFTELLISVSNSPNWKSIFDHPALNVTCVDPGAFTKSIIGTTPRMSSAPVVVFRAKVLNKIPLKIARLLKLKPFSTALPSGRSNPSWTCLSPRSLAASRFFTSVINLVNLDTTRLSLAVIIRFLNAVLNSFPALADIPNSAPFSLVRWNVGSFAILSAETPPLVLTK
ncbi:MAG: hypothetical protein IPK35_03160 [Saprospiraceae bacterium]|nr:hypothetical protein [Saprospiraceae bacterium]